MAFDEMTIPILADIEEWFYIIFVVGVSVLSWLANAAKKRKDAKAGGVSDEEDDVYDVEPEAWHEPVEQKAQPVTTKPPVWAEQGREVVIPPTMPQLSSPMEAIPTARVIQDTLIARKTSPTASVGTSTPFPKPTEDSDPWRRTKTVRRRFRLGEPWSLRHTVLRMEILRPPVSLREDHPFSL